MKSVRFQIFGTLQSILALSLTLFAMSSTVQSQTYSDLSLSESVLTEPLPESVLSSSTEAMLSGEIDSIGTFESELTSAGVAVDANGAQGSFGTPIEFYSAANPNITLGESWQTNQFQTVRLKKRCCRKSVSVCPQDEVWVVSARDCRYESDLSCLRTKKLVCGQWQDANFSDLTSIHQQDQTRETVLYVHGNQTDYEWALLRGMELYQNALATTADSRKPIRYVIWCWRADRERPRLLPDYIIKSKRAVVAGRTLGRALLEFNNRKMVLLGFSLGSQAVLSALENPGLQQCGTQEEKFRVALIAAAVDSQFVCQRLGSNPPSCPVSNSMIFTNKDDRAVKASRLIVRKQCPAGGSTFRELASQGQLPLGMVRVIEISTEIGPKHSVSKYAKSPTLRQNLANLISW